MNQILFFLLIIFGCGSCGRSQIVIETPIKYKNNVQISNELYKKDSSEILNLFSQMLINKEDLFHSYSSEYVDTNSIEIEIDTILYNQEKNKLFVLIIIKFVAKEFLKDIKDELKLLNNVKLFDGIGIMVKRRTDLSPSIRSYGYKITNSKNIDECKERLNQVYFKELLSSQEGEINRYNVDDIRMWEEPMWNKF